MQDKIALHARTEPQKCGESQSLCVQYFTEPQTLMFALIRSDGDRSINGLPAKPCNLPNASVEEQHALIHIAVLRLTYNLLPLQKS